VINCDQPHPEKAFILGTGVESGPGFCRFPGLDSTEAERPSGEARFLFPVRDFLRNLSPESDQRQSDEENQMKQSTKDEIKGSLHEAKGTVKEKAGRVINNPNLAAEGQNEKLGGKVQKKVGQVEKVFEK
jgi:uncharacterized protein YjbJ (UPF0337 family)